MLDTDEIIEALDGDREMLRSAEIGLWLREHIKENLDEIKWEAASLPILPAAEVQNQ